MFPFGILRIPPEYAAFDFANYETKSVILFAEWCQAHPAGTVVDVGCSSGFYSAVALSLSKDIKIIAIDSDAASLKAATRMTALTNPGNRLKLVWGMVGNKHEGSNFQEALDRSDAAMRDESGNVETTSYVNNSDPRATTVPKYTIDALLHHLPRSSKSIIKIDIEGAELSALAGAENFLQNSKPDILLSIHPAIDDSLPGAVRSFLADRGYRCEIVAIDHEEHWWCKPFPNS